MCANMTRRRRRHQMPRPSSTQTLCQRKLQAASQYYASRVSKLGTSMTWRVIHLTSQATSAQKSILSTCISTISPRVLSSPCASYSVPCTIRFKSWQLSKSRSVIKLLRCSALTTIVPFTSTGHGKAIKHTVPTRWIFSKTQRFLWMKITCPTGTISNLVLSSVQIASLVKLQKALSSNSLTTYSLLSDSESNMITWVALFSWITYRRSTNPVSRSATSTSTVGIRTFKSRSSLRKHRKCKASTIS